LLCFRYSFLHPANGKKTIVSFLPDAWRTAMGSSQHKDTFL
jgi:hypothetical protein